MTSYENENEFSLFKQVPVILRARGYRLYAKDNQRLIDLWLNGGAAVLGHTPKNFLREIKNAASRGLYAPLPHFTESRYIKALSKLFPGRSFRLFAAPPPELAELFKTGEASLWRPFANSAAPFAAAENVPLLVPVLPGIQLWRGGLPMGLCAAAASCEEQLARLPHGDSLSPVLLAAAARGVYDLLASGRRSKPNYPRITKALQNGKTWQQRGIYLYLKENCNNKWEMLFREFLAAGFLLPPAPSYPLILPGELSAGEEAKLASALLI